MEYNTQMEWKNVIKDAALRGDRAFYQLIEQIPVMIHIVDEKYFNYANPALCQFLGYGLNELLKIPWVEFVAPEMQEIMIQRAKDRRNGLPVPDSYELVIEHKGKRVYAEIFNISIEINHQKLILAGAFDITARKEAEAQLLKIQEQLEYKVAERTVQLQKANEELTYLNSDLNNIFMNMSDGVLVVNELGHIDILNKALSETLGDLQAAVEEKIRQDIIKSNNYNLTQLFKKRTAFRDKEYIIPTKKGDLRFLASGTPMEREPEAVNRGILILKNMSEVHDLVNRLSGAQAAFSFSDILSNNLTMREALQIAIRASSNLSTVLIQGESGTGKEMFAQSIHNQSGRNKGPFVAINCGAIPRELVGSELFGYNEGAFTGAKKGGNPGKFELASGGTLFLDEIGDMPLEQQVALLRVLQEKRVMRIGGDRLIQVDVRVICATNKDLLAEVENGNFRRDLYYRLSVIPIHIPPLRERREDIQLLLDCFLDRMKPANWGAYNIKLTKEAGDILRNYSWPGNVRELQNVVERILNIIDSELVETKHLPHEILNGSFYPIRENTPVHSQQTGRHWIKSLTEDYEKQEICRLLNLHDGNVTKAAREMGISRNSIYKKIKRYEISLKRGVF